MYRCVIGRMALLVVMAGCSPTKVVVQPLEATVGNTGAIARCLEGGAPLSDVQLEAIVGPPDRVAAWGELEAMLKTEAGLTGAELAHAIEAMREGALTSAQRYLHTDKDITPQCAFWLYGWNHPGEVRVPGLFAARMKGTYSNYYTVYEGRIIGFGSILRAKPERME